MYASRVTGSAAAMPDGRPVKRFSERSKLCHANWTGLCLPANQPLNSSSTPADQSRIAAEARDGVGVPRAVLGVLGERRRPEVLRAERLLADLDVDAELPQRAWSCRSKSATVNPSASGNARRAPESVRTTSSWPTRSSVMSNVVPLRRSGPVVSPRTST